ncbi:hypothetical protein C8J56DRAFT_899052 [Mycena floridula]|nr:hypothetical protein C8J56DRAFT_899052 [Mycena floridula]
MKIKVKLCLPCAPLFLVSFAHHQPQCFSFLIPLTIQIKLLDSNFLRPQPLTQEQQIEDVIEICHQIILSESTEEGGTNLESCQSSTAYPAELFWRGVPQVPIMTLKSLAIKSSSWESKRHTDYVASHLRLV